MKNLLLFAFLTFFFNANSQCLITGPSTLRTGTILTFSVPENTAQCAECYAWTVTGNVTFIGPTTGNVLRLIVNSASNITVCVTYLNSNGCSNCCAQYNVTSGPACNLQQNNIGYVHQLQNWELAFYATPPNTPYIPTGYNYEWTFSLEDGTTVNNYSQVAIIPVYCDNRVTRATVVITSSICSKVLTKKYTDLNADNHLGICGQNPEQSKSKIGISPNPSNSVINFEGAEQGDYTISIFDQRGIKISKDSKLSKSLDISKLINGIYIYKITDGKGFEQNGKFVKE